MVSYVYRLLDTASKLRMSTSDQARPKRPRDRISRGCERPHSTTDHNSIPLSWHRRQACGSNLS